MKTISLPSGEICCLYMLSLHSNVRIYSPDLVSHIMDVSGATLGSSQKTTIPTLGDVAVSQPPYS